ATGASWAALTLLFVALITRWDAVGHAPWSNMYEFTTAFATTILAFYTIFERMYVKLHSARSARALGGVAMPVVAIMLAIALAYFPADVHPLVPALQNADLLAIHVACMIVAYSALSVSFVAG